GRLPDGATDRGREDGVRPGKAKDGGIDLPRLSARRRNRFGHVDRRQTCTWIDRRGYVQVRRPRRPGVGLAHVRPGPRYLPDRQESLFHRRRESGSFRLSGSWWETSHLSWLE